MRQTIWLRWQAASIYQWFYRNTRTVQRPPEADVNGWRYIGSILGLRIAVGVVGFLLPLVVVVWHLWITGDKPRSSISQYYHSASRDFLVAGLWVIGFFLIAYKLFEHNADKVVSLIGGIAAIGVATFPTNISSSELCTAADPPDSTHCVRVTAFLVKALPADYPKWNWVMVMHLTSAVVLFGCMAIMSFLFGGREGRRQGRAGATNRRVRNFHHAMGALTSAGTAVTIVVLQKVFDSGHAAFFGETLGIWAFSLSWLAKGYERDALGRARAAAYGHADEPVPVTM